MNYADIKNVDVANGEGIRVSLFVSGCTHHCKNCFNPQAWSYNYGKEFTKQEEDQIIEMLKPSHIKGLSLLGGEPFDDNNQGAVLKLVERVRKELPEKDIWCYTGSTIEELQSRNNPVTDELLGQLDTLVDGKFEEEKKNLTLKFRGSENQRVINMKETNKVHRVIEYDEYKVKREL